jgi:hypothetical protein
MSEGELERACTDQLHISCRIMLTQYMTLTLVAQIKSTSNHVYWKVLRYFLKREPRKPYDGCHIAGTILIFVSKSALSSSVHTILKFLRV